MAPQGRRTTRAHRAVESTRKENYEKTGPKREEGVRPSLNGRRKSEQAGRAANQGERDRRCREVVLTRLHIEREEGLVV